MQIVHEPTDFDTSCHSNPEHQLYPQSCLDICLGQNHRRQEPDHPGSRNPPHHRHHEHDGHCLHDREHCQTLSWVSKGLSSFLVGNALQAKIITELVSTNKRSVMWQLTNQNSMFIPFYRFVVNGLAIYTTWTTIASLINIGTALVYVGGWDEWFVSYKEILWR